MADCASACVCHCLQENVDMMSQYLPLDKFKAIYVVDLCTSLCDQARRKVVTKGWNNVFVVEGDACAFTPPEGVATLVTFSYSLSSELLPPVCHCCRCQPCTLSPNSWFACYYSGSSTRHHSAESRLKRLYTLHHCSH